MYNSKYTEATKEITAAQYIAELICEKIAENNKDKLTYQFWNTDKWGKTYKSQLLAANSLLKIYPHNVIIRALEETKRIFTLRAKWFDDFLQKNQERLSKPIEKTIMQEIDVMAKPKEIFIEKTVKNVLKDL